MFSSTVWFSSVEVEPRIVRVLSTIGAGSDGSGMCLPRGVLNVAVFWSVANAWFTGWRCESVDEQIEIWN